MTMVLAIHATGPYEYRFLGSHDFFSQDFLAVILNQLARFSVPVFVSLSGFGLTMKYGSQSLKSGNGLSGIHVPAISFYRERLYKIGLPFLFWSVLYLAIQGKLKGPWNQQWPLDLVPYLYRTGADYHFYFFHIIFECYFLFPILLWVFSKLEKLRLPLLIVSFLLQLYVSSPAHIWFDGYPRIPFIFSAFFLYWQFPFLLGIFFALRNLDRSSMDLPPASRASLTAMGQGPSTESKRAESSGKIRKAALVFLTLLSFAIVLWEYIFWTYRSDNPGDFNHFTRMSVVIYSSIFFLLFYLWPATSNDSEHTDSGWKQRIAHLAGLSFFVYIVHTWILRGLQILLPEWMLPVLAVLIFSSFGIAEILHRLISIEWIRNVLGLEKRRKPSRARAE